MTKMIQDGFFILKQIRFFPIAYITQNKNYSKCPREMLKSLSMLDLDLEKRKLYFAITHDFVNNRIKRNSRLRTFAKVKFFVRDITIHNQRLWQSKEPELDLPVYLVREVRFWVGCTLSGLNNNF